MFGIRLEDKTFSTHFNLFLVYFLFEAVSDEFLLKISEEQKKFGVNGRINTNHGVILKIK